MLDPLALLSQMNPAQAPQAPQAPNPLLEQMLKAGVVDDRLAAMQPRLRRAQALSMAPGAEGMRVGGTYQAASPLEHLATAMSRIMGNKQMGGVEKEMGGLADQRLDARRAFLSNPDPMAAALSGDPAMATAGGLMERRNVREADIAREDAQAQAAAQAKAAAEAEALRRWQTQQAETERHNRASEAGDKARLSADAFGAVADPVTGRIVLYNKKTGQRLDEGAAPPQPTAGAPLPGIPGKPSEKQRAAVLGASEAISQLDLAIEALKKAPGAYGGVGNFAAGIAESVGGTPAQSILARRYSPEELRAKNQISNVVSKIINERAGANVTLREELRQKFLPQDTDGYDQALQKLGDLRSMMAATYETQGNGLVPPVPGARPAPVQSAPVASAGAPQRKTIGGKTYEKRADGWYEVQ